MMVLDYAIHGNLRNYLDKNYNDLRWKNKIFDLCNIVVGLSQIHDQNLIHRDLHIGNILKLRLKTSICDMGLCKPDYNDLENTKNGIYGVLSYIAPEILRRQNYSKASDIYSFGIIMYEVISGLPPYYNLAHNELLAIKICQGLRPRFNIKVPQSIVHLIKRCLDANPSNRPTADEISKILNQLINNIRNQDDLEFNKYINEEEQEIKNDFLPNKISTITSSILSYKTHSEAIYTSRLLNFNNLPEPKNSDDYYERYDDIISIEYSGN
jgi:serine/threonine protein kinase